MAHLVLAKDTISDACGWAVPPCHPSHLSGPTAGLPLATTLEVGSTYTDTDCDTVFRLIDDGGTLLWVDVTNSGGPEEVLTSISFNAATGQITYLDENSAPTVLEMGLLVPDTIVSNDPGNEIITGTDGGAYLSATEFCVLYEQATACVPQNLAGALAAIPPAASTPPGSTYHATDCDTIFELHPNGSGGFLWLDQTNAGAPGDQLTSISYASLTNTLTYIDENGDPTALVVNGALTSLSWDGVACELSYVDENGVTTTLPLPRHQHFAQAAPPSAAVSKLGDTWWDTANDTLFTYINDGVTDVWVSQAIS